MKRYLPHFVAHVPKPFLLLFLVRPRPCDASTTFCWLDASRTVGVCSKIALSWANEKECLCRVSGNRIIGSFRSPYLRTSVNGIVNRASGEVDMPVSPRATHPHLHHLDSITIALGTYQAVELNLRPVGLTLGFLAKAYVGRTVGLRLRISWLQIGVARLPSLSKVPVIIYPIDFTY